MDTTYTDRNNANETVYKTMNKNIAEEGTNSMVILFAEVYRKLAIKRTCGNHEQHRSTNIQSSTQWIKTLKKGAGKP
jgi:hypothetical protein